MHNIKNKRLSALYRSLSTKKIPIELILPETHLWGDLSLPTQVSFLCRLSSRKTVLEIGTFRGVTTYNLSRYADKVVTLDIDNKGYDGAGYNKYIVGEWFHNKNMENIQQVICDTRTFDFSSLKTMFDVILVDGDHTFEGCTNDIMKGLSVLKPGGIMVIDDYDPTENNMWPGVRKAVDKLAETHEVFWIREVSFMIHERHD